MLDAATALTSEIVPSLALRNWLTLPLPVLEAYWYPAAVVAQQAAACPSLACALTGVMVLSALTVKVSSELVPAKFSNIRPAWSKTKANGTGAAGVLTGASEG